MRNPRTSSVRIDILTNKYLEFCTRDGYKPLDIQDEAAILPEYNLKMVYRADSSAEAYVMIRWKTPLEKENEETSNQQAGIEEEETTQGSSITAFL